MQSISDRRPPLSPAQALPLLGVLGILVSLWSDILLPTLTAIQQDLHTSATSVQQTVSLFFVANAFMCLWHGVISDAYGRRRPLRFVLVVLLLSSLLCLKVTRIEELWVLRTAQGLAAGIGTILCRAIIRDMYSGADAQKMIARTSIVQCLGLTLVPMLGGWLTFVWGWRAVFAFLSVVAVLMLIVYSRLLPETLPPIRRQPLRVGTLWRAYRIVMGSAWFMRLTVAHVCNWIAMFLYVAAAPQYVVHLLGRPATEIYLVYVPMVLGLIAGLVCLPPLLQRWGTQRTVRLAYLGFLVVNILNVALALLVAPGLIHLVPLGGYAFMVALSLPLLIGHALQPFSENAGLAASCQMLLQYTGMALVAGVLAPLLWSSFWLMALGCAALTLASAALLLWQGQATRRANRLSVA
ncbi:MFS transporter [Caballeronia glathei]|nr:MFS transporter [Caballeronia glathei]